MTDDETERSFLGFLLRELWRNAGVVPAAEMTTDEVKRIVRLLTGRELTPELMLVFIAVRPDDRRPRLVEPDGWRWSPSLVVELLGSLRAVWEVAPVV